MTPLGLCMDLKQATETVEELELDPRLSIKAVPVAVSENDKEVAL